jgi:peptide/nickel transport system substrate-binding protein
VIRIVPDDAARAAGLETGEIDVGLVSLAEVARFKAAGKYQVEDVPQPYFGPHNQIVLNLDSKYLSDLRVRQAIAHAIDIATLRRIVWFGYGTLSPTAITPALGTFHDPTIKPYSVDLALADGLLDAAGYPKRADGFRFPLRIALNPANPVGVGLFVQQALKSIGIDGRLGLTDQPGYIKTVYTDRNFDLGIDALSNAFDPTAGVQRVFWSKAFQFGLPFSNPSHYANAEADQLLQQAAIEVDPIKRAALFRQLQQLVHRDIPVIDFIDPPNFFVEQQHVQNLNHGALGLDGNFANIYIRR